MSRLAVPQFFQRLAIRAAPYADWLVYGLHALIIAGVGWFSLQWREVLWPRLGDEAVDWQEMGMDSFQRLSFDVPFIIRQSLPETLQPFAGPPRPTDEAVILYMDEDSARYLGLPPGGPWSREMHARLLRILAKDGAKAVMFDVVFDSESPDDAVLADAIAKHGNVFLGATFTANSEAPLTPDEAQKFLQVGISTEQLTKRNRTLYRAAHGWGLLTFRPVDNDYGVRRLFVGKPRDGLDPWPAASWQVAQSLNAHLPEDPAVRFARRWINYYGPARTIESLSYYRAVVQDGGVPPGYFKNRVVFIGGRSQLGTSAKKLLDEFSTPWSRFHARAYMPGVEIHATTFLNLLHHDWLGRLSAHIELWTVLLLGLALGALRWLQPRNVGLVAGGLAIIVFVASCLLQWRTHLWWNWVVPVIVQIPLGAVLAIAARYYLEEKRKRQLRTAFGFYLSPELVGEIAEHDFALTPGGKMVEATVLFTDLEGFTTLSEKLGDPARLGKELTDYFTRTTDEILAEKGTVIKFIGDAVFAAWGAPLPQSDHAERAVRAAWKLSKVSVMDIPIPQDDGTTSRLHLRTRIGIHTGPALAGNLGSAHRFDYTLIGDAVNFASRLEGANKYTGTTILLSDDTAKLIGGKFLLRRLGTFKVIGKANAVVIHELLGDSPSDRPPWLDTFDQALIAWTAGDLIAARAGFGAVKAAKNGSDGPSEFYLKQLEIASISSAWTGTIELESK